MSRQQAWTSFSGPGRVLLRALRIELRPRAEIDLPGAAHEHRRLPTAEAQKRPQGILVEALEVLHQAQRFQCRLRLGAVARAVVAGELSPQSVDRRRFN